MKINPVSYNYKPVFKQRDNDAEVRVSIREHLESKCNSTYNYLDQMCTITDLIYLGMLNSISRKMRSDVKEFKNRKNDAAYVNEEMITNSKLKGFWARQPNELYSGEQLVLNEKIPLIQTLKDAGFKTVFSLINNVPEYKQNCEKVGLNYIGLNEIGKGNLYPFMIKYDCFNELIYNPKMYMDGREDAFTKDLKEFVEIMKGENENCPYPIYYGCTQGTDMTYFWTKIYRALKDQDPTKPLSDEAANELMEIQKEAKDTYRA